MGLHRKAKTAIKATKTTQITISYKHALLIYKEKYKFNVYIAKESGNGWKIMFSLHELFQTGVREAPHALQGPRVHHPRRRL